MNRNKKILNVTMAAGMAAVLGTTPVIAAAQEADNGVSKEETVYVNATAEGEIKDITVSDWLKNSGSAEGDISDVSDLEGIKNVKGDETFTQDGDKVTWNTDSSDIYYQGTSNKELPVDMKIKYYLDDQEITPEELAGKSGHLRMEVSYTNKSKKTIRHRVPYVLNPVKLADRAKSYPEKLSGGEKQKLALARALYKNAPVVVLDEPTAALDALAESKLYGDFDKLIGNKTAVYISHRLSSTQFCDKVAMFKDGGIVEYGTHSELMDKGGEYANMFNVQAQYYIDNNESEVAVNA